MLYILEEFHSSRGSGNYYLAVEADSEKEAEKIANEYINKDSRVMSLPLFRVKMQAHESLCPVVLTKDNLQVAIQNNLYKKG